MDPERSVVYGLGGQARCLASVSANTEETKFLVGTIGLGRNNEVHSLVLDDDEVHVTGTVYRHPNEIWDLAACPQKEGLFFTLANVASPFSVRRVATLWSTNPGEEPVPTTGSEDAPDRPLSQVLALPSEHFDETTAKLKWGTDANGHYILTAGDRALQLWTLDEGFTTASHTIDVKCSDADVSRFTNVAWCSRGSQFATTGDSSVQGWDTRDLGSAAKSTFTIPEAHEGDVLGLEYNPNRPQQLATSGEDCQVRLWDLRNLTRPLMKLSDHTHWVWSVAYNRVHDQLLLTSGSDCTVNLQSIVSVSSAARIRRDSDEFDFAHEDDSPGYGYTPQDQGSFERPTDGLVATFDQHEESVYSVSWSEASPWVFASLSYDGRVVVNFVPQDEKYKIIL
ncbi:hypothetical protein IWQ60_009910 [Tieghemiomyces parasiticus]|uniref:EIPR1-like beta-propeller domain-containing protein n=1 Tax=Tieghemiomyces parasiticus TaxID=78921 RepID=A0A9W7ZLE4_9FUNG|nr:hypothetical protein IWQ60_009910 [Tieghemiomyces parasiticus]